MVSFDNAIKSLSVNSQNLIKTTEGRKSLAQAVGIAAIGAWARRSFPSTKLGGSKFFFRILGGKKMSPSLSVARTESGATVDTSFSALDNL